MGNHTRWTKEEYDRHLFKTGAGKAVAEPRKVGPIEQACQGEERVLVKSLEPWPFCKMNAWEKDLHRMLRDKYNDGVGVFSQSYTLRWAASCSYTPDTAVVFQGSGRIEFYECKGRKRADGMTKIKTAAKLFPQHFFFLCTRPDGKKGGWKIEQISP